MRDSCRTPLLVEWRLDKTMTLISSALLALLRAEFALDLNGVHGEAHWKRVRDTGLRLAERTGADTRVVELFAYLHDVKRESDGFDREHGARAAAFVETLDASWLLVPTLARQQLIYACRLHTAGLIEADVTVQTCWDADRLDLGRVGIRPNPRLLCTAAARDPETIEWAYRHSRQREGTSTADPEHPEVRTGIDGYSGRPRAGAK